MGTVAQGMLEGSNVEVVNEMIDLIKSQRAYEINQRVIDSADDMPASSRNANANLRRHSLD